MQSIHEKRRSELFVGREKEVYRFTNNLNLPDDDKQFIWNLYGQGGVGKTTLLKKFQAIVIENGGFSAMTDESQSTLIDSLGTLAKHFERSGKVLSKFSERYKKYKQLQELAEADPEIPPGLSLMFGRTIGRLGVAAARNIPGAGVAVELLKEENVVDKFGEIAEFLTKKITNKKDEVNLLINPIEELSPLFIDDVNKIGKLILLGYDTYEKTYEIVNDWLLRTLNGEYGELSAQIQWVMAGRKKLGSEWADFVSITNYVELLPLLDSDVSKYLRFRGISDAETAKPITELSAGIPLWLATLTTLGNPNSIQLIDPTSNAVECFLKWVDDEELRKAAIICALPRQFNKDIVDVFFDKGTDEIFKWLIGQPFVQKNAGRNWYYHELVRKIMLKFLYEQSPKDWIIQNQKLADYYHGLSLQISKTTDVESSRELVISRLFHMLLTEAKESSNLIYQNYIENIDDRKFCDSLHAMTVAAYEVLARDNFIKLGEKMSMATVGYHTGSKAQNTIELLNEIEEIGKLDGAHLIKLLVVRATVLNRLSKNREATRDMNRAVKLDPKNPELYQLRAEIFFDSGSKDKAIQDYDKFVVLKQTPSSLMKRAYFYRKQNEDKLALADYNELIRSNSTYPKAYIERGALLVKMEKLESALKDFSSAISLEPDNAQYFVKRARVYIQLKKPVKAISDYDKAIELESKDDFYYGYKADALVELERYDEAVSAYTKAIEIKKNGAVSKFKQIKELKIGDVVEFLGERDWYACRAKIYAHQGKYEEAISDYSNEIKTTKENAKYYVRRATVYLSSGEIHKAYDDMAVALQKYTFEEHPDAIGNDFSKKINRCKILVDFGRFEESLEAINEIDKDEVNSNQMVDLLMLRGRILLNLGMYKDAIRDILEAKRLDKKADVDNALGLIYSYLGNYNEALKYYEKSLHDHPDNVAAKYNIAVLVARWKGIENATSEIRRAKRHLDRLRIANRENARFCYGLGGLAALQGDFETALSYLKRAIPMLLETVEWALRDIAWVEARQLPEFNKIASKEEFWKGNLSE